jgi:hypothetical protein
MQTSGVMAPKKLSPEEKAAQKAAMAALKGDFLTAKHANTSSL